MSNNEFTRGVNWGKFVATMLEGEDPGSEGARMAALMAAADYAENTNDAGLIDAMSDAWFGYRCHGNLSDGEVCQDCGMINPGPEQ